MKSLTRLVAIGVALMLCSVLSVVAKDAKRLYPACSNDERTASAGAQVTSTVVDFSTRSKSLTLSCLAYEVLSVKGGQKDNKDYCLVEHQTEYSYSLELEAVYTMDNGASMTSRFPIRDMTGGSLTELTVQLPVLSKFSLVFRNLATDPKCHLRLRALLSYETSDTGNAEYNLPTVVAVEPRTVYANSANRSYIVLDYGADHVPSRSDIVTLVDFSNGRCDQPDGDVRYMDYLTTIPSTVHLNGNLSQYSTRATTFDKPNTYRVCHRTSQSLVATQIAVITVYAGNPMYYDIISGLNNKGEVLVGVETTIKFYGYDLDTRKNGDEAKFVKFTDECDVGSPAGGVPLTNDLEPEDNYGPNTTYSLWRWTINDGGSFKVCYKRKAVNVWTEVPFIEDVAMADPREDSSSSAPIPVPTDPSTQEECAMATQKVGEPWPKFKSVEIVLMEQKMPDNFLDSLSSLLCLRRYLMTVAHLRHNEEGKQVVFLVLNCEENENVTKRECSSIERLNYFVSIPNEKLQSYGILSVRGSTHMFAFGDDETTGRKSNTFGYLVLSVSILGATGMVIFAVSRYQERRHHFVQFGLDDDEIDDMYDFNAASRAAMSNQHSALSQSESTRISNAVIEVED
ncbi:hypothetical protein JKF63_06371 [Porcisia hertigi]|uniref:Uncharacterized protein n=1 Tax=Porcisia hertigi TaxID=2761500 RepID=A0A836YHC9_9TRYP|nr:hypothetical protein JKF63_06371 [Porcisia hertigi]